MEYTFEQLKHKTVAELRDIAKGNEHEALRVHLAQQGTLARCVIDSAGIKQQHQDVVGVDKAAIKSRIKEIKKTRDEALAAHDHSQLKVARRTIHRLKRQLHKATV